MAELNTRRLSTILAHAFVVWALCGATIGIGRSIMSMEATLIVHAIGAPIFASVISLFYYRKFNYTSAFKTALIFLGFVVVLDAGLVAPVFEGNYDMFTSLLGTWIPFALIFLATFFTGRIVKR